MKRLAFAFLALLLLQVPAFSNDFDPKIEAGDNVIALRPLDYFMSLERGVHNIHVIYQRYLFDNVALTLDQSFYIYDGYFGTSTRPGILFHVPVLDFLYAQAYGGYSAGFLFSQGTWNSAPSIGIDLGYKDRLVEGAVLEAGIGTELILRDTTLQSFYFKVAFGFVF